VSKRIAIGAVICLLGLGCSTSQPARDPSQTLTAYADALDGGRVEEAYSLLSDEAKKSITFDAFARMVRENPEEMRDLARALRRPAGPPLVTATVTAPSGEALVLVYEAGQWRVDGSAIDLYSQASPKAALTSFVRAFHSQRYDVLLRFVPERSRAQGLDLPKLERAWRGEQREDITRIVQALEAALPTAKIELIGDRATMAYGAGGTVELLREGGVWKIEEFR
jgi:hypothetical protein